MKQDSVIKEFDEVSHRYNEAVSDAVAFTGASSSYFVDVKAKYLLREAENLGSLKDLSVLDLGCGVGAFHKSLEDEFDTLIGVDISEESLAVAKANNNWVDYQAYDGKDLPIKDNSVDIVFASCVLHHVPLANRKLFMENAYRVLKPNGMLLIFEHNTRNPLTRKTIKACPFDDDAIMLKPKELIKLFDQTGLEDTKLNYILSLPSFGKLTQTIDLLFGKIGLGAQYYVKAKKI